MIPRRPYPVCVYLFAMNMYSANATMGQRAVAEATRKHFGLETFSHTTLGRAMKKLASLLEEYENAEKQGSSGQSQQQRPDEGRKIDITEEAGQAGMTETEEEATDVEKGVIKRFADASDTLKRRQTIAAFIGGRLGQEDKREFIEACHSLAWGWYITKKRLLL